jgi:hypothetical protein
MARLCFLLFINPLLVRSPDCVRPEFHQGKVCNARSTAETNAASYCHRLSPLTPFTFGSAIGLENNKPMERLQGRCPDCEARANKLDGLEHLDLQAF